MNSNEKCVMIVDQDLPIGWMANAAAILDITLGKHIPQAVGPDVTDKSGRIHRGIITVPVPILKADKERLRAIRERLFEPEFAQLLVVDFSDVAQCCNVYDACIEKAATVEEGEFTYFGIGICGAAKAVNHLTGNLSLLR